MPTSCSQSKKLTKSTSSQSQNPKYKEQMDFMSQMNAKEIIFSSFTKKQLNSAIEKINQELFQKRCAPQRPIETITLIDSKFKLTCKIITEFRMELYVFYGVFDLPCNITELQLASNSAGNTIKIEFNE